MADTRWKVASESSLSLSDIVGEESQYGKRMQAGVLLDMMDLVAGRVAYAHCECPVATVAVDRVDLNYPILHGDLVSIHGTLAHVGKSSMMVDILTSRKDMFSREWVLVQRSVFTMVALGKDHRPNTDIPGLKIDTREEEERRADALRRREVARELRLLECEVDALDSVTLADLGPQDTLQFREFVSLRETELHLSRQFLPRHLNINNTVFGGDLLLWMDKCATYTARHFTRNMNMVTIAMDRIEFKEPINVLDLVRMTARVVGVTKYTVDVELCVILERGGSQRVSHHGLFTILNYDNAGFKARVLTGLRLDESDTETLKVLLKGKRRRDYYKAIVDNPNYRPLPISGKWLGGMEPSERASPSTSP